MNNETIYGSKANNRTFMISRNTAPGMGKYAGHWMADNHKTWESLRHSIAGIMNNNMFGIPLSGPNICGEDSVGVKDEDELCARWIQAATFFPFTRHEGGQSDEPWRLEGFHKDWARNAVIDRYQYIRHMYTCMFEASEFGDTCFDPLLFHYADDEETMNMHIDHTYIVGSSIKVSPRLTPGNEFYTSYFPLGTWVSLQNYSDIIVVEGTEGSKKGEYIELNSMNPFVNAHLRPGHMVIKQDNLNGTVNNTEDM